MSRIDKEFIDNLQNFTDSLEGIVELLKKQVEKDDAINKMLSNMDSSKMEQISTDLKQLIEITKSTDDRTKEILNEIKAAKKQKETGLFGKIEDKDNKKKIVSGIQTVGLIASAVLSMGLAFKIIGKVDVGSVIALSIGIAAMSYTFSKLSEDKNLNPKKIGVLGLAVISMSIAITAASLVLRNIQSLTLTQMLSFVFISAGLGAGLYFISKSLGSLSVNPKDLAKYFLLPIILPLIAAGISYSSIFLKNIQPIGLIQAISAVFVGMTLAAGAFAIKLIVSALSGKDGKIDIAKISMSLLLIPGIALGIVGASYILNMFQPIKNPFGLLIGSAVIAISLLLFAPTVWLIGKLSLTQMLVGSLSIVLISVAIATASHIFNEGIYNGNYPTLGWSFSVALSTLLFVPTILLLGKMGIKNMLVGSLGVVVVSAAIMIASQILSVGNYTNAPDVNWALGVGLSLILFTPAVVVLGLLGMTGIGAIGIVIGAGLSVIVAGAIVSVSHVLSQGKFKNYPTLDWAMGVSLLTLTFGTGLLMLGIIPFGGKILRNGAERMNIIAQSINDVGKILSTGTFTGGPSFEWSRSVAASIGAFSYALSVSSENGKNVDGSKFAEFIKVVAQGMVAASEELAKGKWSTSAPSPEWGEGVSKSLSPFLQAFDIISKNKKLVKDLLSSEGNENSFTKLMRSISYAMVDVDSILSAGKWTNAPSESWSDNISKTITSFTDSIGQLDEDKIEVIEDFADAIKELAKSIDKINLKGLDKLSKLTANVTIVSALDKTNLDNVLSVLDDKRNTVTKLLSDVQSTNISPIKKQESIAVETKNATTSTSENAPQDIMIGKMDEVLEKFDLLLDYMVSGKGAEKFNKGDSVK
jgi:hypothetical protein